MKINWHQLKNYVLHFLTSYHKGHGVHSPFAYQLCEEVFYNHNHFYAFEKLNALRELLLKDKTVINVQDFGAGSNVLSNKTRLVKNIASKGISRVWQSETLFKLMNFLNSKSCVELGTSVGLNTMYLASVNSNTTVTTIEACEDLYLFAKELAEQNAQTNINFIHATFDEALPKILNEKIVPDFFYIDGNHRYEASLRYFNWILEKANSDTVIAFDDIYWSKDMTKAWKEIKSHPKVRLSIDTFHTGFVFFKEEIKEKVDLKFFI